MGETALAALLYEEAARRVRSPASATPVSAAFVHNRRALFLDLALGDPASHRAASHHYAEAVRLSPEDPKYRWDRGNFAMQVARDLDQAVRDFEEAARLTGRRKSEYVCALAMALRARGEWAASDRTLDHANGLPDAAESECVRNAARERRGASSPYPSTEL